MIIQFFFWIDDVYILWDIPNKKLDIKRKKKNYLKRKIKKYFQLLEPIDLEVKILTSIYCMGTGKDILY